MSSPAERKLVFTLQPTNTIKAATIPPVQVAVLDSEGKVDIAFTGNITISLDDEPIPPEAIIARPENSTPYRLRATAAGCVDGVSNVFYVLQPYQPNVIEVPATDGDPPPLMFHYTDRAGLIGIIQSKAVWATHIRYLNDSSEYSYTSNLALELAKSLAKEITDEREQRAFTEFQQNLSSLEFNTHYFVFSLSADGGDRLSQWRAYGKAADVYSLGFESEGLKELARAAGGRFIRCIYDPAVQQPLLRHFLKRYLNQLRSACAAQDETGSMQTITDEALDQLNQLATYFKDQAFMEEDEWRLIMPYFEARTKVKYRGGRSLVTPYIELPITLPDGRVPLKQIGLGPAPHHRLDGAAVIRMCNDNGIYPSACAYSAAPYRAW